MATVVALLGQEATLFLTRPSSVGWRAWGLVLALGALAPLVASRLGPARRLPLPDGMRKGSLPVRRVMILSACAWRRVLQLTIPILKVWNALDGSMAGDLFHVPCFSLDCIDVNGSIIEMRWSGAYQDPIYQGRDFAKVSPLPPFANEMPCGAKEKDTHTQ